MNLPDDQVMEMFIVFYLINILSLVITGLTVYYLGVTEGILAFALLTTAMIALYHYKISKNL